MSRVNLEDVQIWNARMHQLRLRAAPNKTLAAAYTITDGEEDVIVLDPGGAHRDVTLPASSASNTGRIWFIINTADAAENLVIKNAAAATIITVNQNEMAMVININGTFYAGILATT